MQRKYRSFPLLLKRIINYLAVELQYRLATPYVRGYPYVLIIDPTNICNLKCPLCPTGLDMPGRPKGRMDFSLFKKIIDGLGDYTLTLVLYNWGEPLLNKEIYLMIEYAKQRSIKTIVSSNFNILNEKDAETLVKSGLDRLIVSLDGTNSETYEEYRKGGNYHRVIANIELLVRKKAEMKSSKPEVIWQFLVFKHNVQDIPEIKRTAKQLGVDGIDIFGAYLGGPRQTPYIGDEGTKALASKWLFPDRRFKGQFDYFSNPNYLNRNRCYFLWKTLTINWDASISPCCCVYDPSTDFGNIREEEFHQIWNNDRFRSSRALFGKKKMSLPEVHTICDSCMVFKKPCMEKVGKSDEDRD